MKLRLLIVGLDGATLDLIRPWAEQGALPNLQRLMERGTTGELVSTWPPVSAPAWISFMTGKNPGRHGVLGFEDADPRSYVHFDRPLVTSAAVVGQTFFDILGRHGLTTGVITVPVTYPPWDINGFMVSGYPCPDLEANYTHPPNLAEKLPDSLNSGAARFDERLVTKDQILEHGLEMLERRTDAALTLCRRDQPDCLLVVLGDIDRAHHEFWRYIDPNLPATSEERASYGDAIRSVYRKADEAVGRLLGLASDDTLVVVMSDHGGGPAASRYFNINTWLAQSGYLKTTPGPARLYQWLREGRHRLEKWVPYGRQLINALKRRAPGASEMQRRLFTDTVNWDQTQAYWFKMYPPVEGIEINLQGRQDRGIVPPAEYQSLREELREKLSQFADPHSGKTVVQKVLLREEVYAGRMMDRMPDLILVLDQHYEGGSYQSEVFGPVPTHVLERISGKHTMKGILLTTGRMIVGHGSVNGASLVDLAPTILYAMGVPIPRDMDGRILYEIFEPSFLERHSAQYADSVQAAKTPHALSPEEEKAMRDKLRGLGYLS